MKVEVCVCVGFILGERVIVAEGIEVVEGAVIVDVLDVVSVPNDTNLMKHHVPGSSPTLGPTLVCDK
jgi:hypothetical protein